MEPQPPVNVLAVDDSADNLLAYEAILQRLEVNLIKAASGTEALKQLLEKDVAVILMDVHMPGMDGFETASLIRQRERLQHVPLIFVTGSTVEEMQVFKGYSLGAVDYLIKPFGPAVLRSKINVFVDLFKKTEQLKRQAALLREAESKEHQKKLAEEKQRWETKRLRDELDREKRHMEAMAQKAAELAGTIAERERAQVELRASEERYRSLVQTAGSVIFSLSGTGTIREWNHEAERIYGWTRSEALGKDYSAWAVPQRVRAAFASEITRVLDGATVHGFESPVTVKGGGERILVWNFTRLPDARDDEPCIIAVGQDISESRRLEEQFRQAQKMEAVGRLAGGVDHDFNNLLTIINGYGQLAYDMIPAGESSRELIHEIRLAGERAASLTRQLLAFSRQQIVMPRILDLMTVVADTEKMLRRLIGEDIRLNVVAQPNLWLVKADPGQVEQVLMNLAVNARDAMPRGGNLTIELGNVRLDENYARTHPGVAAGRYVQLSVSDSGCGMDAATKARIFEPFFTTKGDKGTGLGLATIYGIVKQAAGHVDVYSEPGRGATFKVYLPQTKEGGPLYKSAPGLAALPGGNETILLVEDEDGVRSLSRRVLQSCGYTVLEARDGAEAVELGRQHPQTIDLLLTDVVMPKIGGRELADKLVGVHPEMKVLFVSGYADDAVVRHGALEAEMAFLQKPFAPASLAVKVRDVLDQPAHANLVNGPV
jgi:PAS domain S-box-containing protein